MYVDDTLAFVQVEGSLISVGSVTNGIAPHFCTSELTPSFPATINKPSVSRYSEYGNSLLLKYIRM